MPNPTFSDYGQIKIISPEPNQTTAAGGYYLNKNFENHEDRIAALAAVGVSGFSGYSGKSGFSGYSGKSGFSGYSGRSGFSGYSGKFACCHEYIVTVSGTGDSAIDGVYHMRDDIDASLENAVPGGLWAATEHNAAYLSGLYNDGSFILHIENDGTLGWTDFAASGVGNCPTVDGYANTSFGTPSAGTVTITNCYTGKSGFSGYSGAAGANGAAGASGFSGYSGKSGFSGYSGAGTSGFSGYSGAAGAAGGSGFSGYSGISGFSGYSGKSGFSGYSGPAGATGTSGFSGYSGAAGAAGASGFSGYSGVSGFSGYSGANGAAGATGASGFSGYSGISGFSGYSGRSGFSGYSGRSGFSGYSGFSGKPGISPCCQTICVTIAGDGEFLAVTDCIDASTLLARQELWSGQGTYEISIYWNANVGRFDMSIFDYQTLGSGNTYYYFCENAGCPGKTGWVYDTDTLNNGVPSTITINNCYDGAAGASGVSGFSGYSGKSGFSGYSGSGASGFSGYSGKSGFSGYSGAAGAAGASGFSGYSGRSGFSGYSGANLLPLNNSWTGTNYFNTTGTPTPTVTFQQNNAAGFTVGYSGANIAANLTDISGIVPVYYVPAAVNGDVTGGAYGGTGLYDIVWIVGCFLAGTPVLTPDGHRAIETIAEGDKVISMDEQSGFTFENEVIRVMKHDAPYGYLIINEQLQVTANHKVYLNEQWQPIGNARIGDYLINKDGQKVWLYSIETVAEAVTVYNLKVKHGSQRNYFANDLLVHNKCPFLYVFDKGHWSYQTTFLYEIDAKEKETTQRRKLRSLTNHFVIRELEPETSYIKSLSLIAITPSGEKRLDWVNRPEGGYVITRQGDILKADFAPLPDDTSELFVEAEGYYLWSGD